MRNFFKKFISLTLIVSFVFSPYISNINFANAQNTTSSYGANGSYQYGSSFNGISGGLGVGASISGVAGAITKLPLCRDKLSSAVKSLFTKSKIPNLQLDKINVDLNPAKTPSLDEIANDDLSDFDSVQVQDPNTLKTLKELKTDQIDIKEGIIQIQDNNTCLRNIGQLLAKDLLKRLTLATVNWISEGAEGQPFWIADSKNFWKQLADNEILQFGYEISDEVKYPFGKQFLQQRIRGIQNGFAKNAEYSLDALIQKTTPQFTADDFQKDFSAGGWAAWTFLTQIPANNPLGFQLLASNELDKRLEGTEISAGLEVRAQLAQSGGFLNDVRCAKPKGLSREAHNEAIRAGILDPKSGKISGACERWEAVTPGSLIAEAATQTIHSTENSILQVDDLNSAVAAIIDAFLAKLPNSIAVDGYSNTSGNFSYDADDGDIDIFGGKTQIENDFTNYQRTSEWIQNNPDFNIRTDLTQALIDEQRTYSAKLEEQNNVLLDLNKTIFQLDYCIPGPHPGWENDSREVLDAVEKTIPSKTAADFENITEQQVANIAKSVGYAVGPVIAGAILGAKFGTAVGSVIPGAGNVIGAAVGALIGILIGVIIDWIASPDEGEKLELYYSYIFRGLTGVKIEAGAGDDDGPGITSKQDITNAMDYMLTRYADLIHKYYIKEWLPPVATEAAREFAKVNGYFSIINENQNNISLINGVSKRLGELKTKIDELNKQYGVTKQNPVPANEAEYEKALKDYISEFALLSKNLATGDDIAEADSLMKEAREEIKYVFEDLLTGEYGCEKYIEKGNLANTSVFDDKDLGNANKVALWSLFTTRRAEYPFAVWYDYNVIKDGDIIKVPDELITTYNLKRPENKMPVYTNLPVNGGPGFLSNVIYDNSSDKECENQLNQPAPNNYWLDCLKVSDLFNEVDKFTISVTQNFPNYPDRTPRKGSYDNLWRGFGFENTIGVY